MATTDDHEVFKWSTAPVFCSCCRKGDGISAHFSADREGIRLLKDAINEFCGWAFDVLPWCKMIFACIVRPSVERLVVKCGFSFLDVIDNIRVYVRYRKWEAY